MVVTEQYSEAAEFTSQLQAKRFSKGSPDRPRVFEESLGRGTDNGSWARGPSLTRACIDDLHRLEDLARWSLAVASVDMAVLVDHFPL